jgi:hypothetical protein
MMTRAKTFILHGMTKHGAIGLFRFYEKNYGVKHIAGPEQISEGRWRIEMTHPFPNEA